MDGFLKFKTRSTHLFVHSVKMSKQFEKTKFQGKKFIYKPKQLVILIYTREFDVFHISATTIHLSFISQTDDLHLVSRGWHDPLAQEKTVTPNRNLISRKPPISPTCILTSRLLSGQCDSWLRKISGTSGNWSFIYRFLLWMRASSSERALTI